MPTIMCWNIQNFSQNKIITAAVQAYIMSTIYGGNAAQNVVPDILIVLEAGCRNTPVGDVPLGAGALGIATLYNLLLARDANWRVVPPISLGLAGRAEAIAVFYRSNIMQFNGPHIWSDFGAIPAAQIAAQTPPWTNDFQGNVPMTDNYPAPWNVAPFNVQGALAPQMVYPNAANTGFIDFPMVAFRRPLRTEFIEIATNRVIDMWSFHTSPNQAAAAMLNLAIVPDITVAPVAAAGSIRIVCGDMNINASNVWAYANTYGAYTALGYVPEIGREQASHINPPTPTMYVQDRPTVNNYLRPLSVDNLLTWVNGNGVAVNGTWVVDRVAAGAPAPYTSDLGTALAQIQAMAPLQASQSFRSWANFGHIGNRFGQGNMRGRRGASDHLPILLQF